MLYDTALVIGAGRLFVGDSDSFIGVGYVSPSTSGGTVAGAVIGTLLAVGILGGAVWYWKVKLGGDLSSLKARLGFANGGASGYAVGNGTSGGFATGSSTGGYNASGKTAYTYESL